MTDILTTYAGDDYQINGFNPQRFAAMTESKRGFVKPNKFMARIPLPRGFQGLNELQNTNRDLEFWCESASLPGAALATRDVARYGYGPREKRPVGNIFQDLNFTFYADSGINPDQPNRGTNWDFFTSWVRMASNFNFEEGAMVGQTTRLGGNYDMSPYELSYKTEYAVDIDVAVFRSDGSESHHIVLRDAFPTYVQEINTAWHESGSVMIIPVLMTYTDWFLSAQSFAEG